MPRQPFGRSEQRNARSRADPLLEAAFRYLAGRDRTEAQLGAYLHRRGALPEQIKRVVRRCRALGYLDDQAYALRWARARLQRRPMGARRLEAELSGQGFDQATVKSTVKAVYGEVSERARAQQLLERRRATPALLRRYGFDEDTIESVCGTGAETEVGANDRAETGGD